MQRYTFWQIFRAISNYKEKRIAAFLLFQSLGSEVDMTLEVTEIEEKNTSIDIFLAMNSNSE